MFQVRLIAESELPDLLRLYAYLNRDEAPPLQQVAAEAWREICSNPRYRYVGAYVADKLVSSCAVTIVPNLTRGARPYGVIENVVTHVEYRRKGLGRAVLRKALDCCWSVGCYKVMLATGRRDDAIDRFYSAAGFSPHEKQAFVARPPA